MEEEKQLKRLKRRDEWALEWFIDRYASYVNTVIYRVSGAAATGDDLEELASDVFLTLWVNAEHVCTGKVKAYLGGVARNKAKELMRKRGTELPLEDDLIVISGENIERDFEEREQARYIRRAVLAMEEPEREIFCRYYYFYQTVAEIGAEMGMNPSTVKTRLHRGRKKLKDVLTEGGYTVED